VRARGRGLFLCGGSPHPGDLPLFPRSTSHQTGKAAAWAKNVFLKGLVVRASALVDGRGYFFLGGEEWSGGIFFKVVDRKGGNNSM